VRWNGYQPNAHCSFNDPPETSLIPEIIMVADQGAGNRRVWGMRQGGRASTIRSGRCRDQALVEKAAGRAGNHDRHDVPVPNLS